MIHNCEYFNNIRDIRSYTPGSPINCMVYSDIGKGQRGYSGTAILNIYRNRKYSLVNVVTDGA